MVHPDILLFGISGGEILILLLLVLLLFGPGKIPEMARMVGRGMREVKKVQREINTEIHRYSSDIEKEAREMRSNLESQPEHTRKAGGSDSGKEDRGSRTETNSDQKTKDSRIKEDQTEEPGSNEKKASGPDAAAGHEDDDLPYPYGKKKENDSLNHS